MIYTMHQQRGFSTLEVLVSMAIFSFILLAIISFVFWLNITNLKAKADANTLENARTMLDVLAYEVKGAKSIYTPTTTASQLSLETLRYLPAGEDATFIDFFLCGTATTDICLKKETQNPIILNSDKVKVTDLSFTQITNGARASVKITLTVENKNPTNETSHSSSVTLNSTVSLRSY